MDGKYIAYYRVSTEHQGSNGNGIHAQRKAVEDYLNGGRWKLVAEFTEVESGKRNDRPELEKALAACKKHRAKLVIAKLDRLSRNVHFISGLMERKVDFVACDMPSANAFMINIYAAVAQEERRMISDRTKAGLAAAKARGVILGNPKLAADNRAAAIERAEALKPVLSEMAGLSARAAATELNKRAIATPTGTPWSAKTVIRLRERLQRVAPKKHQGAPPNRDALSKLPKTGVV
jgi:DNA invertase Pin-like site-specific DNA recombinase